MADSPNNDLPAADFLMAALWDAAQPIGICVPGYEIMSEISRGGMGVVYHAQQLRPKREVALKVLLPHLADEPEMLARFQLEARAMAALDHPGILPVYEVGEADGVPFFSMKLATGGSLSEKLRDGRLTPRNTAELLIQLTRAVHHAHQHGVLHRDLKPGNFLFMDGGQAFVSDFGLAKLTMSDHGQLTRTESFFGTPHYMPPEVAAGSVGDATVAGDLYSMGAVLYECLTGRRPHEARENIAALLRSIADDPITPPAVVNPELPRDLSIICMKSLERNPADRYANLNDFADDLERWLGGMPVKARPVGPVETTWRWARRHPLSAGLIAALLAVTIIGTALLAVSHAERGAALTDARQKLQRSLIDQARSERLLGSPGHRERALAELKQASGLAKSPEIRDEAAALLARPDISSKALIQPAASPTWQANKKSDDPVGEWKLTPGGAWGIAFHNSGKVRLWQKDSETPSDEWLPHEGTEIIGEFTHDENAMVLAGTEYGVIMQNLMNHIPRKVLARSGPMARFLSIDPTGNAVALARVDGVEVLPISESRARWHFGESQARCAAAWSADGSQIAVAVGDRREAVILAANDGAVGATATVTGMPQHLAFHPGGSLLAIASDDGMIAICETSTGAIWTSFHHPASALMFSEDGKALQVTDNEGVTHEWSVSSPVAFHEWRENARNKADGAVSGMTLSPDGARLLTASTGCIAVWSVKEQRQTGYHLLENQRIDVRASAWWLSNREILLQVPGGWERLTLDADGNPGTPSRISKVPGSTVLDVRRDGSWIVSLTDEDGKKSCEIWPGGDSEKAQPAEIPAEASKEITATHAASGNAALLTQGNVIEVKHSDGTVMRLIPPLDPGVSALRFSQDGRQLIVLTRLHRVFSWDLGELSARLDQLGL